jgi:hypothetical protein
VDLEVLRISSGEESTLGALFEFNGYANGSTNRQFLCYVLEDQFNEPKIPGETRIPPGRYQILERNEGGMIQRYKKRFPWHKGMLWLQDVPGFTYVYIHVGNDDDDTEGCLLVGDGQSTNVGDNGMVTQSVNAYRRLYNRIITALETEDVWITIEDYA